MKVKVTITSALLGFFISLSGISAESPYRLRNFDMRIQGTSNIRDWESKATVMHLELEFDNDDEGDPSFDSLSTMIIRVPVADIEGSIRGMNRTMQRAMKADRFPETIFRLDIDEEMKETLANERFNIRTQGTLEMAGVTRKVDVSGRGRRLDDGDILLGGSSSLKMSDFNIDPPTLLFGALRTRDEIEIVFTLRLTRK